MTYLYPKIEIKFMNADAQLGCTFLMYPTASHSHTPPSRDNGTWWRSEGFPLRLATQNIA